MLTLALAGTALRDGLDLYQAIAIPARSLAEGGTRANGVPRDNAASPRALQALVSAHLFGVSVSSAVGGRLAVPDTSLVLTGTMASPDPSLGYALIGTSREKALVHPVGGSVAEGVVLRAVYPDHVIVERAGKLAAVFLPQTTGFATALRVARVTEAPIAAPTDESATNARQPQIAQRLEQESAHTAAFLRQEPFYSQGRFRGIVIEPGADPGVLARLGLRAGDVLQHVDGAMVVEPDRLDMLRERLARGGSVRVSVIRPGVGPVDLTIDGDLVAGMIEN